METFCNQVETWFSRDTTKRWEHALRLFFENHYTLGEIQGFGKDLVRVTFQGYPALLLHLDIHLDEDEGLAFELLHYGMDEEILGKFSCVPVSAFIHHPDQLIGALHQQTILYH